MQYTHLWAIVNVTLQTGHNMSYPIVYKGITISVETLDEAAELTRKLATEEIARLFAQRQRYAESIAKRKPLLKIRNPSPSG